MQLDVRCMHMALDRDGMEQIRRRFEHGLDHFAHVIQRGRVLVSDVNGPKGGADKHCLVQLRLRGAPDVVIEEDGVDLFSVIGRAADRLTVAVGRALGREKRGRRQDHRCRLA